ncbi:MAG TPA: aconitate hydratase AcnA [Candidatus Saccharimonadales bacterium]|nr:aconitate hydratase AcnA [Candidatus Saccharimonadales bacterium]
MTTTGSADRTFAHRELAGTEVRYHPLDAVRDAGLGDPAPLPVTLKVLLESIVRRTFQGVASPDDVRALAQWPRSPDPSAEIAFLPARILLQDFTGVPAVVDLAAMRTALARAGIEPSDMAPSIPVDLVIDHSVQVDSFGAQAAYERNIDLEYERNGERYALLRWAQQAFPNFRVVPPGMGICHQVNLERLSRVVQLREQGGARIAIPDTLVGTDSHTTMVNGLGVLGWGVGGIEAEAAMLGQPMYLSTPRVVGVRFTEALRPGATATDLVLTLTELLRRTGVVNAFVEFCGAGLSGLSVADRATLSNMCPEYGATAALFPPDQETLRYLEATGREPELVDLVERYTKAQGMFRTDETPTPVFSQLIELDLATVEPSLAGPKRPQDRVGLAGVWESFMAGDARGPTAFAAQRFDDEGGTADVESSRAGRPTAPPSPGVHDGSVVIAAITSCTNTSNPSVMIAAGLLAKRAVERGLRVAPTVKTSLAPGSRVVTDYLRAAGLMEPLEALGFYLVGYGCTTCIGNSGPLADPRVEAAVKDESLNVVAVLSGNRNFEGRIHPLVRSSYLASPPLVVAYALAGTVRTDLTADPLGRDGAGEPVYLRDLWPSAEEVATVIRESVRVEMFEREYHAIFEGDERWRRMPAPSGAVFAWDPGSTYVREPPFFQGLSAAPPALSDIIAARALLVVGDSVTTDHISPAGSIPSASPAGRYLIEHGVEPRLFNSYGARRGDHEVMIRGTFANIRLRNGLVPGREGWWTKHLPDGEVLTIFDAAERYRTEGIPLIVIAGKEYGSGSSRDWAAKGPALLGVRAVIAESFERIHRSNLVGMGILPLELPAGTSLASLGLTGEERFSIRGLAGGIEPRSRVTVDVVASDGTARSFDVIARLDNDSDVDYLRHGGILPMVLRTLLQQPRSSPGT